MAKSKYERYEMVEVHRSQIKNAPYNPRFISDAARAKLRKIIKKMGLVQPLTWNSRSGNLVAGHQRLSIIDSLEDTPDYSLTVAKVDLDPKAEKAANIALNNAEAQGEFDMKKLEAMFQDEIDVEATGFDAADVMQMFGEATVIQQPDQLAELAEKIRAAQEVHQSIMQKTTHRDDINFYLVAVFKDSYEVEQFLKAIDRANSQRFIDGRHLAAKLGITLDTSGVREVDKRPELKCDHCKHPNRVTQGAKEAVCEHCKQTFAIVWE